MAVLVEMAEMAALVAPVVKVDLVVQPSLNLSVHTMVVPEATAEMVASEAVAVLEPVATVLQSTQSMLRPTALGLAQKTIWMLGFLDWEDAVVLEQTRLLMEATAQMESTTIKTGNKAQTIVSVERQSRVELREN